MENAADFHVVMEGSIIWIILEIVWNYLSYTCSMAGCMSVTSFQNEELQSWPLWNKLLSDEASYTIVTTASLKSACSADLSIWKFQFMDHFCLVGQFSARPSLFKTQPVDLPTHAQVWCLSVTCNVMLIPNSIRFYKS